MISLKGLILLIAIGSAYGQEDCDYFEEDGYNYVGNDMAPPMLITTFEECWNECESEPFCYFVSLGPASDSDPQIACRLKSSDSGRVADARYKSGGCRSQSSFTTTTTSTSTTPPGPEECDRFYERGWRIDGKKIGPTHHNVGSTSDCFDICKATNGCNFVSRNNARRCYLFGTDTVKVRDSRFRIMGCRNKSPTVVNCNTVGIESTCVETLENNPWKCYDESCPYFTEGAIRYDIANVIDNGFHDIDDAPTADYCAAKCKARNDECKFFTFIKWSNDRGCYLLPSDTGKVPGHQNDVSGGVQCLRSDKACPPNFVRINNICLHLNDGYRNYGSSENYCEAVGGRLYEPRCQDTDTKVGAYVKEWMSFRNTNDHQKGLWMGIEDRDEEGRWEYRSDGKRVKFTNWSPGQPNGQPGSHQHTRQDCGFLNKSTGLWADFVCSSKQKVACEKPAN